jgi:ABC-type bacteriocin/lantibiotic exporter with double-glycine peptidase domain
MSVHGPPRLHFEPLKLLSFDVNADPDSAFPFNADPDPSSKINGGSGSGSSTLLRTLKTFII